MKLNEVYEGWRNHIAPSAYLEEQITEVSASRMSLCRECPYFSKNNKNANPFRIDEHCTHCGCTLAAKTKCLSCGCPLHKWEAIISSEEEKIIEDHEKKL